MSSDETTPEAEISEPEETPEPQGTAILETGPPIPPPAPPPTRPHKLPLTRLMLGALFVAGGALWLLGALDMVDVSVTAALSVALIVVGLALVAGSMTGRHSGLIMIGIVLTVGLAFTSTFDIRLDGGMGERTERPTSAADLKSEYKLGVGQLTLDLSALSLAPGTRAQIKARVGIGELLVHIGGAEIYGGLVIEGHAGLGQVTILGRESSGFDVDFGISQSPAGGRPPVGVVVLDLSVGLGQVTVDGQ
jgi:hypothetical protein